MQSNKRSSPDAEDEDQRYLLQKITGVSILCSEMNNDETNLGTQPNRHHMAQK